MLKEHLFSSLGIPQDAFQVGEVSNIVAESDFSYGNYGGACSMGVPMTLFGICLWFIVRKVVNSIRRA